MTKPNTCRSFGFHASTQPTWLETQIAKAILRGEFTSGDTIFVDVENERLAFKRLPSEVLTTQ